MTYDALGTPNDVRFALGGGTGFVDWYGETYGEERGAGNGSLYLSDDSYLVSPLTDDRFTETDLYISNVTSWAVADLVVSNCSVRLVGDDFAVTVASNVRIDSGGLLDVPWLTCGGDLLLTNGGALKLHARATNGTGLAYGSLLDVSGDVTVAPTSWLYPYSDPVDAGSVKMRMNQLTVATNAGIQASGRGFAITKGPGAGSLGSSGRAGGGGYGGAGGDGATANSFGGDPYGSTNAPAMPGSGGAGTGGQGLGGYGGGLIWIQAVDTITLDGTIEASGRQTMGYGGGGSGGGIFMDCWRFSGGGSSLLIARGGNSDLNGGGGGGGRIAVWWGLAEGSRQELLADPDNPNAVPRVTTTNTHGAYLGEISVTNGTGANYGELGTVVFLNVPPPAGTMILLQ
ncbi:MAG: hypothetical protein HQ559_05595 [Lentisphaerae bacterium]|nr:hypothetical protein [Lentisphaerota bacterium]